jgi:iron(III) transport system substrate-binding protein
MSTQNIRKLLSIAAATLAGIGAAHAAGEVNVYTSREPQLIQPVFDAFTKSTGIAVRTIFVAKGLEERIRAEGASSPADLIVVVDYGRIAEAKAQGITRTMPAALLAKVPTQLRDGDGHWTALTLRARIIYAARDRFKGSALAYEDLADPAYKGKVCIRSGKHEYNISLISAAIERMGPEKAAEWLRGIKANLARKAGGGDRDVAKDIAAGACDLGPANTYYLGLMSGDPKQKSWAEAVKALQSAFRGGGTHVNISAVAVARNAPNPGNAEKLVAFMLSGEAQKLFADRNFEYPVIADAPPSAAEKLFGKITPDTIRLDALARHRALASELVDRVGFDN